MSSFYLKLGIFRDPVAKGMDIGGVSRPNRRTRYEASRNPCGMTYLSACTRPAHNWGPVHLIVNEYSMLSRASAAPEVRSDVDSFLDYS